MNGDDQQSRREFLRSAGRYGMVALLAGGAAALLLRGGSRCLRPAGCRACPGLSACALPEALVARAEWGGKPDA